MEEGAVRQNLHFQKIIAVTIARATGLARARVHSKPLISDKKPPNDLERADSRSTKRQPVLKESSLSKSVCPKKVFRR